MFSAEPVCSWAAYLFATRLRDRGCSAHPVFPAPSILEGRLRPLEGQGFQQNSGRIAPRDREAVSRPIHVIACNKREALVQGSVCGNPSCCEERTGLLRFARNDGLFPGGGHPSTPGLSILQ